MPDISIAHLPEYIASLPDHTRALCNRLLHVEKTRGTTVPPPEMIPWIEHHFGARDQVQTQTIVKVTNLWTLESASFNPLRARRPQDNAKQTVAERDAAIEDLIAAYSGTNDTFNAPYSGTPADIFGRIEGRYAVSASNVAKYDGWHGLVIFNEFHPLRFNHQQLRDYFDVALRWLVTAHRHDPAACYPLITWNCLWKSGASITHGHMQMILSRTMATGQVERLRRAAVSYNDHHHASLNDDLWTIHQALGLAFHDDMTHNTNTRGYVTLTPIKDREIVLTASPMPDLEQWSTASYDPYVLDTAVIHASLEPLWDATYTALRGLIDHQGVRSFNLVVYLPPLGSTPETWKGMEGAEVRMVDRGDVLSRMVNFGAMELFASSIISVDPFAVATTLRKLPMLQ